MMSTERNDAPSQAPEARPNPATGNPNAKVIKRYSNRKLYDTERSRYVTLDEIAKMVKAGDEVVIIDNETKEDLTSVTLTQIIYEEEKRGSRMPLGMLRNLIQTGGSTLQDFFERSVKTPVVEMTNTVEKSVEKGVEELKQSAVSLRDAATRSVNEFTGSARRIFSERRAEEFKRQVTGILDQLDETLGERVTELNDSREKDAGEAEADKTIKTEHAQFLRQRLQNLEALVSKLEQAEHR